MSRGDTGQSLSDWVAPARTAVVVVDMQVDFGSPEGVLGKAGVDMTLAEEATTTAKRLVDAARAAGAPVVFVGLATDAVTDSKVWATWRERKGQRRDGEGLCRSGSLGAAFHGPQPNEGEAVVWKLRYSGFFGTGLDATLRALGVDTLIVCGLTTECCVDCTVRDAFQLDYYVFVPADACAAYDEDVHATALANLALNCANVVSTDEILDAWGAEQTAGVAAQ